MSRRLTATARRHVGASLLLLSLLAVTAAPFVLALVLGLLAIRDAGWIWHWWLGVFLLSALPALLAWRFWRPRPHGVVVPPADLLAPDAERRARAALATVVEQASAEDLRDGESVGRLLQRAVNAAASGYAPEAAAPTGAMPGLAKAALSFTLPELLLMTEELARRLRAILARDVPALRHLELRAVLEFYETGTATLGPLLELYRVARWVNPLTALLDALKSELMVQALDRLTAGARAGIAATLAREVGEAAIDLYAGRWRRAVDERLPTAPAVTPVPAEEPLTLLLAGPRNSGKSSLLNALLGTARLPVGLTMASGSCTVHEIVAPAGPCLRLIDSPGLTGAAGGASGEGAWLEQAGRADLVLWILAANRADRALDRQALEVLRALTAADSRRRAIPLVLVATHADRLNPPLEWSPPYDSETGARLKEVGMREALRAAGEGLGIPPERRVLVAVPHGEPPWNLEALWARIHDALPDARQKQLERGLGADGWFRMTLDGLRTLPGLARRAIGLVRR